VPDTLQPKKVDRSAFLYEDPRPPVDQFAQCGTCVFFQNPGCPLIGDPKVTAKMSCGLYCHGKPGSVKNVKQAATPKEAGLVNRPVRCENCRFFKPPHTCGLFEMLNHTRPNTFSLNTRVNAKGCCDANTAKGRRGFAEGGWVKKYADGGDVDDWVTPGGPSAPLGGGAPAPVAAAPAPDDFASAILATEASRQGQVSPKGAVTPMQVIPKTAATPGYGVKPAQDDSEAEYERVGHDYADAMLARYGDPTLAAAAYDAGPARVDAWLKQFGDPRKGQITDSEFAQLIPYQETRGYLDRFGKHWQSLSATPLAAKPADDWIVPNQQKPAGDDWVTPTPTQAEAVGAAAGAALAAAKPAADKQAPPPVPSFTEAEGAAMYGTGEGAPDWVTEAGQAVAGGFGTGFGKEPILTTANDAARVAKDLKTTGLPPSAEPWLKAGYRAEDLINLFGRAFMGTAGAGIGAFVDTLKQSGALGAIDKATGQPLTTDESAAKLYTDLMMMSQFPGSPDIMARPLVPELGSKYLPFEGEVMPPGAPRAPRPGLAAPGPTIEGEAEPVIMQPGPAATAPTGRAPPVIEHVTSEPVAQAPPEEGSMVTVNENGTQVPATVESYFGDGKYMTLRYEDGASRDFPVETILPDLTPVARAVKAAATPQPTATGPGTTAQPVVAETNADVTKAEEQADREPTPAQIAAGNYKKAHLEIQGLPVTIETPAGAMRRGVGPDGKPWEVQLQYPYGYVKGTKGADGEQVDTYIGPHPESPDVFVFDQIDPATGKFDEHKAVMGARNADEAAAIYDSGFSDGSGPARRGDVTPMTADYFKEWLNSPRKGPVSYAEPPTRTPADATEANLIADLDPGIVKPKPEQVAARYGIEAPQAAKLLEQIYQRPDSPIELAAGRFETDPMNLRWRSISPDKREARIQEHAAWAWNQFGLSRQEFPSDTAFIEALRDRGDLASKERDDLEARAKSLDIHPSPEATPDEVRAMVNEREAIMAESADAERRAEMIEAEIDDVARRSSPEVMNEVPWFDERNADREAEAGEGAEAPVEPRQIGHEPEPAAGEAAPVARPGEVPARGGPALPEGAPAQLGARPVDSHGRPILKVGDRVVIGGDTEGLKGRHGTVSKVDTMTMQPLFGGKSETSYHYTVKTDQGLETMASQLEPETERPTGKLIPDPMHNGHFVTPEQLRREAEFEAGAARRQRAAADRARKPERKRELIRAAEDSDRKSREAKASLARWQQANPGAAPPEPVRPPEPVPGPVPQPRATVRENPQRNGIEVKFNARPDDATLGRLKAAGFRWSKFQKIWYAKLSDATRKAANEIAGGAEPTAATPIAPKTEVVPLTDRIKKGDIIHYAHSERGRMLSFTARVTDAADPTAPLASIIAAPSRTAYRPGMSVRVPRGHIDHIDRPVVEIQPVEAGAPPSTGWHEIGKNAYGETLYEDQRGVRSVVKDGVRRTEPVQMVPTRQGMQIRTPREGSTFTLATEEPAGVPATPRAPATPAEAKTAMDAMRSDGFLGTYQLGAVAHGLRGEEAQYFRDKMVDLKKQIDDMPKTYDQKDKGDDAVAYLHYFTGGGDWYITEKDMEPGPQHQAFGLADPFHDGGELGYISLPELTGAGAELDFHWKPKTLAEIRRKGESPTAVAETKANEEGARAEIDAAEYQPASMPITTAAPELPTDPDGALLAPGDKVALRPEVAPQDPRGAAQRSVIDVSPDRSHVTLDGGAVFRADQVLAPGEEIAHGVPERIPEHPAGEEPAAVQRAGEERPTGGAPSAEDVRGLPSAGPAAGTRAEGQIRPVEGRPSAAAGRGAGLGADVGRAGAGERAAPGAAGGPADATVKGTNYSIEPGSIGEDRGPKAKALDNVSAIELAKRLIAEGRPATRAEQAILAKYVGWGGLPGVFKDSAGNYGKGFEDVGKRLVDVLTPEEYQTAAKSTQYAHYTADHVIRSMWHAVERMGFKGGTVFEPGMGVGHFLGMMPPDLARKVEYQGIELDHLTADIAKLLYPESGVRQADMTATPLPDNEFDLAIGNPPFSDTVIKADPKYRARGFMLHDYFFAKSMDSVRPGGLLGFVTSAGTMNKLEDAARRYLAARAEFVGGVRLPSTAFKRNAGTEVTTDILFFKKRPAVLADKELDADPANAWTQTVQRELPNAEGGTAKANVSRYFTEHPEQVLGTEGLFDKLYKGRYAVHEPENFNLEVALRDALDRLPADIMERAATPEQKAEADFEAPETKDGSFYVKDGRLMQYRNGVGRAVAKRGAGEGGLTAIDHDRITHLVPMRDALRDVFGTDLAEDHERGLVAREKLNRAYDAFVKKFGPVNKATFQHRRPNVIQQEAARAEARELVRDRGELWREGDFDGEPMAAAGASLAEIARARDTARQAAANAGKDFDEGSFDPEEMPDIVIEKRPNIDAFMDDPESYRLRAIEDYNESTGKAEKKRVFSESVLTREVEPVLNSANDGVLWSLNKFGRLDLPEIAGKMKRTPEDLVDELGESVFRVPGTDNTYVTADEYLSGDVVDKLAEARAAAARDPALARNVTALEGAQPAPLAPSEITMTLGMPWIPAGEIREFARDHLRIGEADISHSPAFGGWIVTARRDGPDAVAWGTQDRGAFRLLSDALNRTPPRIYKDVIGPGGEKSRVFDPIGTQAAVDKMDGMKQAFEDWLGRDPDRRSRLADIYNEQFNRIVPRRYDGSYLTTPGVSKDFHWRPHQRRAVARIVQAGSTYLGHAVGAGKTAEMIGGAMEMRRLGLIKKPMFAVPNHMLGQFTKEFYEQYPTARISVADERHFHTATRKQFIANAAQDDLDGIIITHSAFGKLPISRKFQAHLIQEEIDRLKEAMEDLDPREDRITRKRLENMKEKLEQKLSGAFKGSKDQTNTFEEMGVDFLFVDEAHIFRKLSFATKQGQLKGISPEGSDMAWDLYSKIRYLESKNPGRSIVLASGTPVTNTMGELYTLSRYMQPQELAKRGIDHFDSWATTFGDTKTALEQTADGNYQSVTRFAKFVNVPELYKMVSGIMDIVTPHELDQYVVRPKLRGGKRQLHLAPKTPELEAYQRELAARVAAIKARKRPPLPGDDILLSVINDGRHAAIDMRFIDPNLPSDPESKLNALVDNVHRIWKETKDAKFFDPASNYTRQVGHGPATQMIFANLGTGGTESRAFSGYAWMKRELMRRGVPQNEIAIIKDYKSHAARQKLFNDMNEGKVRILIGSTQKMGTGVNAQRRLYALHNQDPLWYPTDDEQRVGRGLRQGNLNPEIEVHDYSTKGTYDATMWHLMGNKGRFIEQFFRGDPALRDMEDLGEASQYEQASAIATADERLIKLTDLRQQLDRANRRKTAHEREQYGMRKQLDATVKNVDWIDKSIPSIERDIAQRVETKGDKFKMTVGKKAFTERKAAADAIGAEYKAVWPTMAKGDKRAIGELGGFPFMLENFLGEPHFGLQLADGDILPVGDSKTSAAGMIRSGEAKLEKFEDRIEYLKADRAKSVNMIDSLRSQIGKPFTGDDEINRLSRDVADLEKQIKATQEAKNKTAAIRAPIDIEADIRHNAKAYHDREIDHEEFDRTAKRLHAELEATRRGPELPPDDEKAAMMRPWLSTDEIRQPQSVRELAENIFGGKMASMMPLKHVDGGVLATLYHNQIRRAVTANLPVNVVDYLKRQKISPDEIFSDPNVVVSRLAGDHLRAVTHGILIAARRVSAGLRAKLSLGLAAGRDEEILPTLHASDLTSREVVGVLAPESIYHERALRGSVRSGRAAARAEAPTTAGRMAREDMEPASTERTAFLETALPTAPRTETPDIGAAWPYTETRPARIADFLDWHRKITLAREGIYAPIRAAAPGTQELVPLGKHILGRRPVTERYTEAQRKIAARVNAILGQIAPSARIREMGQLFERGQAGPEGEIYGAYYGERLRDGLAHVVAYSLAAPDHVAVVRHEAIHYLRRAGLLNDDEWSTLSQAAKRDGWIAAHKIDERYPDLTLDEKIEEAVAEEFAGWRAKGSIVNRLPEWLRPIFAKLDLAFRRIAAAVRQILGRDATPDDVFSKVETGEVDRRSAAREPVGAAAARPEEPLLPTREATQDELAARERQRQKAVAEVGMRGKKQPTKPQMLPETAPLFGGKGTQGTLFSRPEVGRRLNPEQRKQLKAALEIARAKRMTLPDDGRPVVLRNDFGISRDRLVTLEPQQIVNRLRDVGIDAVAAKKMAEMAHAGDQSTLDHVMELLNPKISQSKKGDILHLDQDVAQALRAERQRDLSAGGGGEPPEPPLGAGGPPPEGPGGPIRRAAYWAWRSVPGLPEVAREIQMGVAPMAVHTATEESRHIAKQYANEMRLVSAEWVAADDRLVKDFNPLQRRKMWDAADEESVLRQRGLPTEGRGKETLTAAERAAVERNQAEANDALEMAKEAGMFEGEGLPSYAPRMVVMMTHKGMERVPREHPERAQPVTGGVHTTSPHLIHRKYLEAAETEEAAKKKFGTEATVLRDIRTLPLATANLKRAVAGRVLLNRIDAIGKQTGQDLVVDGEMPVGTGFTWFTLKENPAFWTWRPKFTRKGEDGQIEANVDENGKIRPLLDENGDIVWERIPRWVRGDFEGPLKAVMSGKEGVIYRAFMDLKAKTMSVIMYSPLIHNGVEWGRALPAMPGKVLTFKAYFEGNAAKRGIPYYGVGSHIAHASWLGKKLGYEQLPESGLPPLMREFISAGLVPIGHRYAVQDITSMMEEPTLAPGRSWTSKVLSFLPGLYDGRAGEAVKRAIDRAGNFWHNTLLWDRVGDLQVGLAIGIRDEMMARGMSRQAATIVAAHFANRFAGALPLEAMSAGARKAANMFFFSRTFTFGNLGAMKDAMIGLPKDVQAELANHATQAAQTYAKTLARRKAAAVIMTDIALFHIVNAVLQSTIAIMAATFGGSDDQDTETKFGHAVSFQLQGYVRRLNKLLAEVRDNPLKLFDPLYDLRIPAKLLPQSENEPGKQDRVLVGYAADGTAIYMRNPTGKIGEEFEGWLSDPLDMIMRKMGTIARPLYHAITNDKGFGRHVWDPNATTLADHLKNIGRTVELFIGDQVPITAVNAAWDYLHGVGEEPLEVGQMAGPLLGMMFSHGAPGGPAVGELYQAKQRHEFEVQQQMPDVRKMIQGGNSAGAIDTMTKLGMSPGYQRWVIMTTLNPGARLSKHQLDDFARYASPDEKAIMEQLRTAP
jgi:N12 class adenine-specific DNA methylase/tRNA1(Val) A37 N6-methylase TrmN6